YLILDSVARVMAPILPFTSEEIWKHMPSSEKQAESIHLMSLPVSEAKWKNPDISSRWTRLFEIRSEIMKALEEARAKKLIGHPLDASVTLFATGELYDFLNSFENELRSIFITSEAVLTRKRPGDGAFQSPAIEGLFILVAPAPGEKCERCWVHDPTTGSNAGHPGICGRCVKSLEETARETPGMK
ncbi:MAG: class I tRNA ligase family protein, partial [Thermodesulfobacteriota bacterium]